MNMPTIRLWMMVLLLLPALPVQAASAPKGEEVYQNFCAPCHATGVAGAPKLGDKAAWAPRLKAGEKTLVDRAIKGFQGKNGVMPPRGGNSALTDAEVAAAVAYMTAHSK